MNKRNSLYKKYPSCTNEISKEELLDPPLVSGFKSYQLVFQQFYAILLLMASVLE